MDAPPPPIDDASVKADRAGPSPHMALQPPLAAAQLPACSSRLGQLERRHHRRSGCSPNRERI